MISDHTLMSLAGLPAQLIAQGNLGRTRGPLGEADKLSTGIRKQIKRSLPVEATDLHGESGEQITLPDPPGNSSKGKDVSTPQADSFANQARTIDE